MRGLVMSWRVEFNKQPNPDSIASPERIRVLRFKEMETHLRNALLRRSTHVPYDRLYEIEGAFRDIQKLERYEPTTNEGISCVKKGKSKVNIQIYEDAYHKLEKALKLPSTIAERSEATQVWMENGSHKVMCMIRNPVQVIVLGQL